MQPVQEVVRLLEQAQAGQAVEAVARADVLLGDAEVDDEGNVDGDHACLHFVRVIAFNVLGDIPAFEDAVDRMLLTEASPGWRAAALASRAGTRSRIGEAQAAPYDLDGVLHDLVTAESLVLDETEPVAAVNARVAIAIAFYELRLYELVGQHYEAAYALSAKLGPANGNRAMWLINLAELHLVWALELYQVGDGATAETHTTRAEEYGKRAAEEAQGPDAEVWSDYALLAAACAMADRQLPIAAATEIGYYLGRLRAHGISPLLLAFSGPFHAVALRRSGALDEALEVIEQAIAALPTDTGVVLTAAHHHTHAQLLAALGSSVAAAGTAYGRTLAVALWQQRLRTLNSVETIRSMEQLRVEAWVDPLTGLANRRAFDAAVRSYEGGADMWATVLVIDTDKFKQINDTDGHAAGDAALRAIAESLSGLVRADDLVARLGGDEFAVLLPGLGNALGREVAQRMAEAVRALDGPATLSIGVAGGPASTLPSVVELADAAMYKAKRRGGDGVEVHEVHLASSQPVAA
ncbi:GGDEF domain-containing protein [Paractinoplanes lichenicola]|uniref:GGDEF domain-containing protein n=1 Tax=Paractinoplanes lichenicola TaxID=2802976 RepID=A0ABS1VY67_9ACTN|nr:GGDEF domain-containing protein [Actinoplanes lichenicola]MBL7259445.1 GGDEF domain-containing protein [Actinoplanes lichenicola]